MPRPNVPTTRSLSLRWISRSRTAIGGIPLFRACQCWPPSRVAKTPNSVPTNSSSGVSWSTAIV